MNWILTGNALHEHSRQQTGSWLKGEDFNVKKFLHNFTLKVAWNIVDLVHLARIVVVKVAAYCEHSNGNLISVKCGVVLSNFGNISLTRRPLFHSVS